MAYRGGVSRTPENLQIPPNATDEPYTELGSYFLMQFDTNPRALNTLYSRLRADPRVVKFTALKLGDKLEDVVPSILPANRHSGAARIGMGGRTIQ